MSNGTQKIDELQLDAACLFALGDDAKCDVQSAVKELGLKAASLARMTALGIPVPIGFVLTTDFSRQFNLKNKLPDGVENLIKQGLATLETKLKRKFGGAGKPLLIAIRAGAPVHLAGLMPAILNLGLNDQTCAALAEETGDLRFALDSYRRFIESYSIAVLGVGEDLFEDIFEQVRSEGGLTSISEFESNDYQVIIDRYKACILDNTDQEFPQDVFEQLMGGIGAAFKSWNGYRARSQRRINGIADDIGLAVTVQSMVFGNKNEQSATGMMQSRNPNTGQAEVSGTYLTYAQGPEFFGQYRLPKPLTLNDKTADSHVESLEERMPKMFAQLVETATELELAFGDMLNIEFTIEDNKLYILEAVSPKRSDRAELVVAVDLAQAGVISKQDALMRVDPKSIEQLLHPSLDPEAPKTLLARGLAASPGAAWGEIVFNSEEAEERRALGKNVILVKAETSPEDVYGIHAAQGILTIRGGTTSHAAVAARIMARPCVTGASAISIDAENETMSAGGFTLQKGDMITIDGTSGQIYTGQVATIEASFSNEFYTLMQWADQVRKLKIRVNTETPELAIKAQSMGAEGIGLCRTEHMFFDKKRIVSMREMILAEDEVGRKRALDKLLPMQRKDFVDLFTAMSGFPVTIRLLDPPLHEFLPKSDQDIMDTADAIGIDHKTILNRLESLSETNPMLGHRGCRLAITHPEIYDMQVQAIFEATILAEQQTGDPTMPEIMIPFVSTKAELVFLKDRIEKIADEVANQHGARPAFKFGTMIELPRACLRAEDLAELSDFFSFGSNDLTQTTYGISRDDSARFLNSYTRRAIIPHDPFVSIDKDGVGELVKIAVERGHKGNKNLIIGVCGEHGGDPYSIHFYGDLGLDYVSCAPFRVPVAKLAAAQNTIMTEGKSS
ncbi:MAG: pyruvate, phosphate dikinase [Alphaproteobacteria bacterium]|nr:pyruvate, phosphate dikinase [Alphaproteobacteria bacterium]